MSFTLIDFFNGFQSLKAKRRFLATTQSTYFAILAKFNLAKYPATLDYSTRDLQIDAGLKSVSTAHECRNVLKNNKLIDFKTERGTTVYRLLTEHLPNKNTLSAEQQPNAKRTAEGRLNSPVRGEVEKIDREESDVREGEVAEATKSQVSNTHALPLSSPISETDANAIHDEWAKAFGERLRGGYALELEQLAAKDYARTITAIGRTKAKTPQHPFAYFKGVYSKLTQDEVAKQTPAKPSAPNYTDTAERKEMFGLEDD